MKIEQLYTSCLAQAAYYIENNGEAAIIDPLRDYQTYIDKAEENGVKIKYIFETHFHADFVSGHIDLAKKTGAKIIYGPNTITDYKVHVAKDGEILKLGDANIQVIHTPGHTLESSCFLLKDKKGKNHCVFTGDTLFVGDVGRPDLLDGIMTKEELASKMYDSLKKLTILEDEVIVYPAHGAGSACGKNIGKETFSTIGEQKLKNYALQEMSREQFIKEITSGISPAPAYFFKDAKLNKSGYPEFDELINKANNPLSLEKFEQEIKQGATIIDTRIADIFEYGFIPGSLNFGLNGQYAIWAATILDLQTKIILVCKPGTEKESIERLSRVGFDQIISFLDGGFETWLNAEKRYDMVISISSEELALDSKHNPKAIILDVRKASEYKDGHVARAINIALNELLDKAEEIDKQQECLVYCAGGYRSMIAASILKQKGFQNIKNVWGGYNKIKEEIIDLVVPNN
jgi:glyoxylase-like metal-dependent hydrolase (beta-lactamase superfamily II)/rhodanese-related sulfurtransferase